MNAYKRPNEHDLAVIATFLDRERILWKDEINEEYSHDELTVKRSYPDLVARVTSAQEVSKILAYANEQRIAVTPRGAGTGLVGASVAVEKGIMIDTTLMNHILELDEENLTLTVEPGVLIMTLRAYVEEHGFFLSARSRRKVCDYRRQHQHQCRRHDGCKIRRHSRFRPRARSRLGGRNHP